MLIKYLLPFLLITITLFGSPQTLPPTGAATKHALIIAIADYPKFPDISSDKDIPLIEGALTNQGFTDITVLLNEEATKAGIVKAFNDLLERVEKNDVAVIHFSSHGQQIFDDNNDESDQLDEAIVCYDAQSMYNEGYHGEQHLRDDETGEFLDKLRTKLGKDGDVVVFMDACHSGTGTRGEAKVRFGGPPLVPEGFEPGEVNVDESSLELPSRTRGESDQATLVVFSASRADEVNYEYDGYGSLSYAISKALNNLSGEITYRGLFSSIQSTMAEIAKDQNPISEGIGLDRKLFGGDVVTQEQYFTITMEGDTAGEFTINGGSFANIYPGAKFEIHPIGTLDPKKSIAAASGEVIESSYFSSKIRVENMPPDLNFHDGWVFITEYKLKPFSLKIRLEDIGNSDIESALMSHLSAKGDITILQKEDTDNADLTLSYNSGGRAAGRIAVKNAQSGELFSESKNAGDPLNKQLKELDEAIERYAQSKMMREVELDDEDYEVVIDFIPVKNYDKKKKAFLDTLDINDYKVKGMLEVTPADTFLIKVTNLGFEDAYFNIIDFQPDGVINLIVPNPRLKEDASAYKIPAGEEFIISNRKLFIFPPYGREVFKVFASAEPLDFKPIIKSKGKRSVRGRAPNPIEKILKDSFSSGTRGGGTSAIDSDSYGYTSEYVFMIKDKR